MSVRNVEMKWPPDMFNIENSFGFKEIEKPLKRYMQYNNFKLEEIQYIFCIMNTFCFLNKPKDIDGQEK